MADIHAVSFEKGWDALDMSVHCRKDICLGTGDPLSAFIICSNVTDQSEILTIATHPDCRQKGLGEALLNYAIETLCAAGVTELFLEVAEDNDTAKTLYRRVGFVPIGRRPNYYRRRAGRIAAITFSKKL